MTAHMRRQQIRKRYLDLAKLKAAIVEGLEYVDSDAVADLVEDFHRICNAQAELLAELSKIRGWV